MKKLLIVMLSCFGFLSIVTAQDDMQTKEMKSEVTKADYEKYFDAKLEMDYRNSTIKALDLTREEILVFDPIFSEYLGKKQKLSEEKMKLVADLKEELSEDDSEANEMEDRADFVEDYWEVEIDEMELKKDYFDIFESNIAKEKAMKFFLWEDFINNRMKENAMYDFFPIIIEMRKKEYGYNDDRMNKEEEMNKEEMTAKGDYDRNYTNDIQNSIEKLDNWVSSSKGQVDISHEYTYEGLTHVLMSLETMKDAGAINNVSFDREKEKIMDMAAKLKKNTYSDGHADIARKAFMATADLIPNSQELSNTARKIDADVLMTKQASVIYDFFEQANEKLQRMSKDYAMKMKEENKNSDSERK